MLSRKGLYRDEGIMKTWTTTAMAPSTHSQACVEIGALNPGHILRRRRRGRTGQREGHDTSNSSRKAILGDMQNDPPSEEQTDVLVIADGSLRLPSVMVLALAVPDGRRTWVYCNKIITAWDGPAWNSDDLELCLDLLLSHGAQEIDDQVEDCIRATPLPRACALLDGFGQTLCKHAVSNYGQIMDAIAMRIVKETASTPSQGEDQNPMACARSKGDDRLPVAWTFQWRDVDGKHPKLQVSWRHHRWAGHAKD